MAWSLLPNHNEKIYGPGRRERLRLHFSSRGIGWDFHSLSWERRKWLWWQPHITITRADFVGPNKYQRWVSQLHSFDPTRGEAILKVAEADAPEDAPRGKINYSWRKWDLVGNREIARLQECANPFDPLPERNAGAV
jgi:hypothetical protein